MKLSLSLCSARVNLITRKDTLGGQAAAPSVNKRFQFTLFIIPQSKLSSVSPLDVLCANEGAAGGGGSRNRKYYYEIRKRVLHNHHPPFALH